MLRKLRGFFERLIPSEPFRFSFSKFNIFLFFLFVLLGSGLFYLRSQNNNELQLLNQKHKEIQIAVKNYLLSMSQISNEDIYGDEIKTKLDRYKKQLSTIEEKINNIKSFWFLE